MVIGKYATIGIFLAALIIGFILLFHATFDQREQFMGVLALIIAGLIAWGK